jgi:hypothetical protein
LVKIEPVVVASPMRALSAAPTDLRATAKMRVPATTVRKCD